MELELPVLRGIDPLHPMVPVFNGTVRDATSWIQQARYLTDAKRGRLQAHGRRDPGPPVYHYLFTAGRTVNGEALYIGVTRDPHVRFQQHHGAPWYPLATHVEIDLVDCTYHDAPTCTHDELDRAAHYLGTWYIGMLEPAHNVALGPVT